MYHIRKMHPSVIYSLAIDGSECAEHQQAHSPTLILIETHFKHIAQVRSQS